MTTSQLIVSSLTSIMGTGLIVATKYTGTATTYATFNFEDSRGLIYGDNKPITDIDFVQIHLFTPRATNPETKIVQITKALFNNGFEYPDITRLYEEETETNHIIFSTSIEKITLLEE